MKTLFLIIILSFNFSCAHKQKTIDPTPGTNENANVSVKNNGSYYTILEFEKGTNKLTEKSKAELKEFVSETEKEGAEGREIKILTWPDVKNAGKKDSKLADKRAVSIMNFMKKKLKPDADLLPFNMANRSAILKQFLENDDPKTKKVFEKTGVITEEGEDLASLQDTQTGKALIIRDYE
jgi:hypothetical protein